MLDPDELFQLEPELPEIRRPVLIHALDGFIDAGNATRLAREQLLGTTERAVIARFDVDLLFDYRARRPPMLFVENHWERYAGPELVLSLHDDAAGTPFLVLAGPEPDVHWERFVTAVRRLVERLDVRLTIGLNAIPMAVPHTRPVGISAHATRTELVADYQSWISTVQVPASVGHLLEYRLGEGGHDAMGFAVHVPHYLAQTEYPDSAVALLDAVSRAAGLTVPHDPLVEAARTTRAAVDAQVAQSPDVAEVVEALEHQYDAVLDARARNLLAPDAARLPSADELGAELERFLAEQAGSGDGADG